jgi:hypothetical protein
MDVLVTLMLLALGLSKDLSVEVFGSRLHEVLSDRDTASLFEECLVATVEKARVLKRHVRPTHPGEAEVAPYVDRQRLRSVLTTSPLSAALVDLNEQRSWRTILPAFRDVIVLPGHALTGVEIDSLLEPIIKRAGVRFLERLGRSHPAFEEEVLRFQRHQRHELARIRDEIEQLRLVARKTHDPSRAGERQAARRRGPRRPRVSKAARHSLERIRDLSALAVNDAEVIATDSGTAGPLLLDPLYVTREVEAQIRDRIVGQKGGVASRVLVLGDAGFGKTSILWHLSKVLAVDEPTEPWFLKSTMVGRVSRRAGGPALASRAATTEDDIVAAIGAAKSEGRQPIVLLDTADLLLHTEEDRDALLAVLSTLRRLACPTVVACRPQEALLIPSEETGIVRVGPYSNAELVEAVRSHADSLCGEIPAEERDTHVTRLQEAVAQGRPVREVCVNPLTLRMLFVLYRPNTVPLEINVFRLYREYWGYRVQRDSRAGSPTLARSTDDLSSAAQDVALALLAEGIPELPAAILTAASESFRLPFEAVPRLVSRGILIESELGTIGFFHQTFFEHSAARGLLARFGHRAFDILEGRLRERENDQFLTPVYEHALLLAESSTIPIRERGDLALAELLASPRLSAMLSGVYVYCHRQSVSGAVARQMADCLTTAHTAVVRRFLEIATNMPAGRLDDLLSELRLVWARGTWGEQEHVLDLLARVAVRHPEGVRAFIEAHGLVRFVLGLPSTYPGVRKLLTVLEALAPSLPDWSVGQHLELFSGSMLDSARRDFQLLVLDALRRQARAFGVERLATTIEEKLLPTVPDLMRFGGETPPYMRDLDRLAESYGALWEGEWRARGVSAETVMKELSTLPDGLSFRARLSGLGRLLVTLPEQATKKAFRQFCSERDALRRIGWGEGVWKRLIAVGSSTGIGSGNAELPQPVRYFRAALAGVLGQVENLDDSTTKASGGTTTRRALIQVVRDAPLEASDLLELLADERFADAAPWLDPRDVAPLLVDAWAANHVGAAAAFEELCRAPASYPSPVLSLVSSRLAELAPQSPEAMDALIRLAVSSKDPRGVLRALETEGVATEENLARGADELWILSRRLLTSRSPKERIQGMTLWSHLLSRGLAPHPSLGELEQRIAKAETDSERAQVLSIAEFLPLDGQQAQILSLLQPGLRSTNHVVRERAHHLLGRLVAKSREPDMDLSRYALEAALSPPTNAKYLAALIPVLDSLSDCRPDDAAALLLQLVSRLEEIGITSTSRQNLFGRFRGVTRQVVRRSSPPARQSLLDAVPALDGFVGRLLVQAVCLECFFEVAPLLDRLLETESVAPEVKNLILTYKHSLERPSGGGAWPELYQLIFGGSADVLDHRS